MFSYRTVHYVAFLSILAVLCQMCSAISDIEDKYVFHDENFKEELEQNVDFPHLYVTEESGNAPVEFITEKSSAVEAKREDQDRGSVFFKHWVRERLRYTKKLTGIEIPVSEKRVVRQVNPEYSSLYPTLPTKSAYGSYGPYSNNNVTNSYSYGHVPNATIQNPYNYPNFTRPSNSSFSATGQNLYYNPQYPSHNGVNPYHSQSGANNGVFPYIRPANYSGTLGTTTKFYPGGNNYPQNPSYPQPYGRNNNSYSNIPQPTGKPYYPGTTNGMHSGYLAPSSRPYYPGATSNSTNPYSQSTSRPAYTGATNNSMNSGYPQPYGRPAYPGATYNSTNTGYFPSTSRPGYPEPIKNGVTPVYPQPGSTPVYPPSQKHTYPPSTGKPFYPRTNNVGGNSSYPHNTYPINGNFSNHSIINNNNYSKPHNNLPISPYNTQTRYPPYNPNYNSSSVHGPQRSPYYNSGQTWGGNFQGYGPYSTTPSYGSYNNYTTMPNAQYFGNTPNRPYSQSNGPYSDATWNKPNPSPNQYNAGAEFNNFFYPSKNNGSQYDPHKNPANQFSYHVRK